ncbi:MAG: hypothetical protein R6V06_02480, partial [Kiritimatiellia bacterium]
MFKKFRCREKRERKGSALLIVLGFLTFMMISAVAFAVYMRVERQASSNYRHASSARHLLNAALYRAIDEIDSELRATTIKGAPNKRKFPDWPGRVRNSAVVNSENNDNDARVLSMDALSYIPGILVNDVRRYAVKPVDPGANKTYEGPKWRDLSMPNKDMDGELAYGEAVVGRYAYSCINVSDMLNVNSCKAAVRDADRHRVSLAHFFDSQTDRETFDKHVENTDKRYSTLSDFYACMYEHYGDEGKPFSSPYHNYINNQDDSYFDYADNHVLITEGKAMAEPVEVEAFNLKDGAFDDITASSPTLNSKFSTALEGAVANSSADFSGKYRESAFPDLLADYLDDDNIPSNYNVPSVEIAPMACQIEINGPPAFNIFETRVEDVHPDPGDETVISINLNKLPATLACSVKTMYPFLRTDYRTDVTTDFEIDVNAFLRIHSEDVNAAGPCSVPPDPITPGGGYYVAYANNPSANSFTPNQNVRAGGSPYHLEPIDLQVVPLPGMPTAPLDIWNSGGGGDGTSMDPRFPVGKAIRITLYVSFLGIREAGGGADQYVDMVPTYMAGEAPPAGTANELQMRFDKRVTWSQHRLYFETDESAPLQAGFNVAQALTFKWTGLETPDPRFNYKISNWVQSSAPAAETHNPSTQNLIQDGTGRDSDIFLSVSNAGKMYSAGELGNIIRPFKYTPTANEAVDFATYDYSAFLNRADNDNDKDAMFRTYRLYDHGDPVGDPSTKRHDDLFDWFYRSNDDGSFNGARVNPLSDIPKVLQAAIENVPLDYWLVDKLSTHMEEEEFDDARSLIQNNNYTDLFSESNWGEFTNGWMSCLINARTNSTINTDLTRNIRDEYCTHTYFGWYSDASNLKQPFDPSSAPSVIDLTFPLTLTKELYGVDRKMLYSYTLESFSDRQQLFLYLINAEATAASFGDRARSLAGGRAIALVWRDPYPHRDNPASAPDPVPANMYPDADLISPWHQYHVEADDGRYS